MSSGQLEIVSSTAEFAPIGASQNMPVRMFTYGNLSHGTDKLIMRPEVKSPADLKGKKVAVMVGGLPQIMMGIYLEKNGMPFDSVQYVNVIMDQAAAAMISGTVAGAELWEPFGSQYLKAVPDSHVVATTADPEWAQNALIADAHFINADWAKNHRETALKAIKAMYDAIAWWKKTYASIMTGRTDRRRPIFAGCFFSRAVLEPAPATSMNWGWSRCVGQTLKRSTSTSTSALPFSVRERHHLAVAWS